MVSKALRVRNNCHTEDTLLLLETMRWVFVRSFKSRYLRTRAWAKLYDKTEGWSYSAVTVQLKTVLASLQLRAGAFWFQFNTHHTAFSSAWEAGMSAERISDHQMECPKGQLCNSFLYVCVSTHILHLFNPNSTITMSCRQMWINHRTFIFT